MEKKKKMIEPLKVKRVGRPTSPRDQKKDPNTGFTLAQKDWIKREAMGRGVDTTEIHREMAEMYITAVESQRGDSIVAELFTNEYAVKNVVPNSKIKTQEK